MRFRILVGLSLTCLIDVASGLFFIWFISKIMNHHLSIWTYGLGICLALSPDIDVLFQKIQKKDISVEHRIIGLHYPIFIFIFIILFFLSLISLFLTLLAVFCLTAHFIHDSIEVPAGIKWLWPFSQKYFMFFNKVNGKRIFIRSLNSDEMGEISFSLEEWIEIYCMRPTPQLITGIIAFVLAVILAILSL